MTTIKRIRSIKLNYFMDKKQISPNWKVYSMISYAFEEDLVRFKIHLYFPFTEPSAEVDVMDKMVNG